MWLFRVNIDLRVDRDSGLLLQGLPLTCWAEQVPSLACLCFPSPGFVCVGYFNCKLVSPAAVSRYMSVQHSA